MSDEETQWRKEVANLIDFSLAWKYTDEGWRFWNLIHEYFDGSSISELTDIPVSSERMGEAAYKRALLEIRNTLCAHPLIKPGSIEALVVEYIDLRLEQLQ